MGYFCIMVLESIINPITAEKHPWEMFFFGLIISTISIFLALLIFPTGADLIAVFLTVFACVPLMYNAMKLEESKDYDSDNENYLLKEHFRVISFFSFLFIGIVVSYVLWYFLLPSHFVNSLFFSQLSTISSINGVTGSAVSSGYFARIFLNNIKVMVFCFLFSFFYGSGAIFILTWNASVLAVAIGSLIKSLSVNSGIIFSSFFSFSKYFIHGIPEMVAYMIAGLAGGIVSAAIINRHIHTEKFDRIIFDALILFSIAIFVVVFAALIEVFITPSLFV